MDAAVATPPSRVLVQSTPGLTRDDDHVYRYQGTVVPGITRLMEPIHSYDGVPEWHLERAAERGRDVHYACELYDQDNLHEGSLDPEYVPYVEAWIRFREVHTGRIHAIEPMLYHHSLGYAGQPDRWMQIDTEFDVLEIKTTSRLFNAVGVQLAAQQRVLHHVVPTAKPGKRFAIQLKADGRYELREYRDPRDWPTFQALLTTAHWITRFGGH